MDALYCDKNDELFNKILRVSLIIYLIIGLTMTAIRIAPLIIEVKELPPRIAKLIVPPKPLGIEPIEIPQEIKEDAPTPSEEEVPIKEAPKQPSKEETKERVRKSGVLAALIKEQESRSTDDLFGGRKLEKALSNPKVLKSTKAKKKRLPFQLNRLENTDDVKRSIKKLDSLKESDRVSLGNKEDVALVIPKSVTKPGQGGGTSELGGGARVRIKGNGSGAGVSIDYDEIARVVERYKKGILYLYNRELRSNPTLKGTVTVEFSINQDGKVIEANIVSSTMDYAVMENALAKRIRQWKFPKLYDGVIEVTYPFVFFPV